MNTAAKAALVVGAGGVLGAALLTEFAAAGYTVMGLRRGRHDEAPAGGSIVGCDLAQPLAVRRQTEEALARLGQLDVVVCNAAHFSVAAFADLSVDEFETAWRVGVGSAFGAAQAALPAMAARGSGALLITGATASLRGSANFASLAAAKFALRGLAQSLAREYQPRGVHVVHFVLDGLLRGSPSIARFGGRNTLALDPREVAACYRVIAEQSPNAWSHEIDLRPQGEKF